MRLYNIVKSGPRDAVAPPAHRDASFFSSKPDPTPYPSARRLGAAVPHGRMRGPGRRSGGRLSGPSPQGFREIRVAQLLRRCQRRSTTGNTQAIHTQPANTRVKAIPPRPHGRGFLAQIGLKKTANPVLKSRACAAKTGQGFSCPGRVREACAPGRVRRRRPSSTRRPV